MDFYQVLVRKNSKSRVMCVPDDMLVYPADETGNIPIGPEIQIGSILWMMIWVDYSEENPSWAKARLWEVKSILIFPKYKYLILEPCRDKNLYALEKEEDELDEDFFKNTYFAETYGRDALGKVP